MESKHASYKGHMYGVLRTSYVYPQPCRLACLQGAELALGISTKVVRRSYQAQAPSSACYR
jgi:hypothetical protein